MLKWALFFFVIALIAGLFGFTGIETVAMDVAKFLFFIFLVVAVVFLVLGLLVGKKGCLTGRVLASAKPARRVLCLR